MFLHVRQDIRHCPQNMEKDHKFSLASNARVRGAKKGGVSHSAAEGYLLNWSFCFRRVFGFFWRSKEDVSDIYGGATIQFLRFILNNQTYFLRNPNRIIGADSGTVALNDTRTCKPKSSLHQAWPVFPICSHQASVYNFRFAFSFWD